MASLWRPGKGLYVKQLEANRFIFQFYHEIDVKRVCDGSPWTFGKHQLVFVRLKEGDNPRNVAINNLDMWVQLHGMASGFMSQRVVCDVGNYIGKFIESDANNFIDVWREYLRIRVSIPLDVPLKRRMMLKKNDSNWCWVNFKYEGLPTFCFICGMVGHGEKFCEKLFNTPLEQLEKPYGQWMRAEPRRRNYTMGSKWLKSGGSTPASSTVAGKGAKVVAVNDAVPITVNVNSGISGEDHAKGTPIMQGGNVRRSSHNLNSSNKLVPDFQENNLSDLDNSNAGDLNEMFVADPKRRRLGSEELSPYEDVSMSPSDEDQNQKNGFLAGAAMQACLSL